MRKQLRVAWFSPLPREDSSSLAAYFSYHLLPAMRESAEIELFHAVMNVREELSVPNHHFLRAMAEHARRPFDLFFYQVEDCPSAFFSRHHLGVAPGLVLFHHFRLFTPSPVALLHSPFESVIEVIHGGQEGLPRQHVWPEQRDAVARRELSLAGGVLFSHHRACDEYQQFSGPRLIERPFASFLPTPITVAERGSQTSVPRGPVTIGMCAAPRLEGRPHKVLAALARVPEARLLWLLGEGERAAAEEMTAEHGVASQVELKADRSPATWQELLPHIHLASHLNFRGFLSPFPYLGISLAHGVPVVATDPGEASHISEDFAFGVRPGDHEAQELAVIFQRCAERLPVRGAGDSSYTTAAVADELLMAFEAVARDMATLAPRWGELRRMALLDIEQRLSTPSFARLGGLTALASLQRRNTRGEAPQ